MNKRKIENLRKVAQPEVVERLTVSNLPTVEKMKTEEDGVKRRLERFYAARLSSKDFERSMFKTPQSLATAAFHEAVDATKVWANEIDKAAAEIMKEIWK